jgi:hypothetical protein
VSKDAPEEKILVKLREFELTLQDLNALSDDQKAAFSVIAFAVSEINALSRVYMFSAHRGIGKSAIDYAVQIQRNSLLRIWSSKIFEFAEFLKFTNKTGKTSDSKVLNLAKMAISDFEKLQKGSGYKIAMVLRNTAANHYSFKAARRLLAHLRDDTDCSLFFGHLRSNSFFPLGEAGMFVSNIYATSGAGAASDAFQKATQEWLDWLGEASLWVDSVQDAFFRDVIQEAVPNLRPVDREYVVPSNFVAVQGNVTTPIFSEARIK